MKIYKKNIKLITFGNFPFGGASANLLRYFTLSLSKGNNDVEVLLPTGHYYGNKIDVINKRVGKIEDVKYKYTGLLMHPKNYLGKFIDNVFGPLFLIHSLIISHIRRKIDIVIVYNTTFFKTLVFILLRLMLNYKYIIILPEFYEKPKGQKFSLKKIKWYNFYFGMKYLIKYADGFIVASHFLKKYINKNLNCNKNVLVLPNAMDPKIFAIENIEPYKKDYICIGYTGTPTRKDGATDLIRSFSLVNKKYSDTHLLIIGDITNGNSILTELKNLAVKLNVIDNISFTGLVPFSKIPKLLNSCQILALTRPNGIFAEAGFPTKLGEYFACKKPVVVTKVGDIPRYFTNEKEVILVEPENIENIANGFEKLILSDKLRENVATNAYKWMDNELNYLKISSNINRFISIVLSE